MSYSTIAYVAISHFSGAGWLLFRCFIRLVSFEGTFDLTFSLHPFVPPVMAELQVIPARHGVATFVPAGQSIKIINTSGTQVIDTWAFALPKPDEKGIPEKSEQGEKSEAQQQGQKQDQKQQPQQDEKPAQQTSTPKRGKKNEFPSQEDAEKATQEGMQKADNANQQAQNQTPQKSSWSSYVPSLGLSSSKRNAGPASQKQETEQQKNSRTWGSYFPSGKAFSSYIPKSASDTVTAFAQDVSTPYQ